MKNSVKKIVKTTAILLLALIFAGAPAISPITSKTTIEVEASAKSDKAVKNARKCYYFTRKNLRSYKKVRNGTASDFEKEALSKYYEVTSLKEKDYIDYKYRKQKYLIDLDWQGINANSKEKIKQKYISFYIYKMDSLYKSILKNYLCGECASNIKFKF